MNQLFFYNIVKANIVNAEVNQIFIIVARAQTSTSQLRFCLETERNFTKVA